MWNGNIPCCTSLKLEPEGPVVDGALRLGWWWHGGWVVGGVQRAKLTGYSLSFSLFFLLKTNQPTSEAPFRVPFPLPSLREHLRHILTKLRRTKDEIDASCTREWIV
jgi:hypothetical protein